MQWAVYVPLFWLLTQLCESYKEGLLCVHTSVAAYVPAVNYVAIRGHLDWGSLADGPIPVEVASSLHTDS